MASNEEYELAVAHLMSFAQRRSGLRAGRSRRRLDEGIGHRLVPSSSPASRADRISNCRRRRARTMWRCSWAPATSPCAARPARWRQGGCSTGSQGRCSSPGDIAYPDGTAEQFQHVLRAGVGPPQRSHAAGSGQSRIRLAGRGAVLRVLRRECRAAGPGLLHVPERHVAGVLAEQQYRIRRSPRADRWLTRELEAPGASACTVAYFHHPLFSSGSHGVVPPMPVVAELWRALYAAGVDVIISAHEHFYERFAPQTPEGAPDPQFGIRQFIVGTGGAPLTQPVRRVANSEMVLSTFGVLRLTLDAQSYRWEFLSAEGGAVLDSGTGTCHGKPRQVVRSQPRADRLRELWCRREDRDLIRRERRVRVAAQVNGRAACFSDCQRARRVIPRQQPVIDDEIFLAANDGGVFRRGGAGRRARLVLAAELSPSPRAQYRPASFACGWCRAARRHVARRLDAHAVDPRAAAAFGDDGVARGLSGRHGHP